MRTHELRSLAAATLTALALAACSTGDAPSTAPRARAASDAGIGAGAVYTLTNGTASNDVLAFRRAADGSLTPLGAFATGGTGTGGTIDPLQSQYALVLSDDERLLFAVDAGSDEVSSFRVAEGGALTLADKAPSGGVRPVSLAVHARLLYVLNAGNNTLRGYRAAASGRLVALPHATASLDAGAAGAAAVRFTPDGRYLVVTERASNSIETFPVLANGRLGEPVVTASSGATPFGFDITADNRVVVSEAGGAAPFGAASSYALTAGGALSIVTGSLSTQNPAACWLIATADGRFAYVANAGSGVVTGLAIDAQGALTLLDAGGVSGVTGAGTTPLDLDLAGNDGFLYVLEGGTGAIGAFAVSPSGNLSPIGATPAGAPASGLQGIAAF